MAENVVVLLTAKVIVAGLRLNGDVTVRVELAKFPMLSVTRTTADPLAAGAVYKPVAPLIVPVPLKIENVKGATPPL